MRDAGCELGDLEAALDVAFGVGDDLAVLAGEFVGKLVHVAVQEIDELGHDPGPPLRIGRGPGGLRGLGVGDGGPNLRRGGERHPRRDLSGHRPEHVGEPARRALDPPASNEV